ncbi:MAG: gamma-glutamyl-gamma-aminobutyrate hydrolase family protein [Patescibacteria group bacterium]|jgi:GMP synthase (glutamine-hydrolysing)
MKVLLIDNNTKHLKELRDLIEGCGHTSDTIKYTEASSAIADRYDLSIITGGHLLAIPNHKEDLAPQIAMIKDMQKPLLGICHGFQLIAYTFGAKLHYRTERLKGIIEVNVSKTDPIFGELTKFDAFVSHKYYIMRLPKELIELARSKYNIEALKHNNRPIYGFQFHPEVITPGNTSGQILINLFREIEKRS